MEKQPLFSPEDIVYIAGPMTGKPLFNYVKFFGYAGLLKKEYGCTVLNPARQPNGLTYKQYLARQPRDRDPDAERMDPIARRTKRI